MYKPVRISGPAHLRPRATALAAAALASTRALSRLVGVVGLALLFDPIALAQTAPPVLPVRATNGLLTGVLAPVTNGSVMSITQTNQRAIIDWQSFNIGQGSTVSVAQPAATSVLLNRVVAGSVSAGPSTINGALQANGRIFILDPNGVVLGSTARVNVGGLMAAAMTMTSSDADFVGGVGLTLAPGFATQGTVQVDAGAVIAGGNPNVEAPTGDVVLLGATNVDFNGRINASNVFIGASGGAQVPVGDSGFVSLQLKAAPAGTSVFSSASGRVDAIGGNVNIVAASSSSAPVTWGATIDATGGSITLRGSGGESDGVHIQAASNTALPVQLLARDVSLTGTSDFGSGVSLSGVNVVASNSITLSGTSTFGDAVQTGGFFGLASLTAPTVTMVGRSDVGAGVALGGGTVVSGDLIDLRGVAAPTVSAPSQQGFAPVGVDLGGVGDTGAGANLGGVRFVLGQAGQLRVSGRGELPAAVTDGSTFGIVMDGVVIDTPDGGGRSITFAGEAVNGAGSAGIATTNVGGLDMLTVRGQTGASGADVVFGASAPGNGRAFVALDGATLPSITGPAAPPTLDTTGSVNLRPLGVDVNGNIVEQPTQPIQIESNPQLFTTPFVVPGDWINLGLDSIGGGMEVSELVIGSADHQGRIDVGVDVLNFDTLPLTLQNQGAGSAGVGLQGNTSTASVLTIMSAGPVDQTGALRVARLQLQGNSANAVTLADQANEIGSLGFDRVGSLDLVSHRLVSAAPLPLSLDTGPLSGYDADLDAFTSFTPTANSATSKVLVQTDVLTLNSSVAMSGSGSTLDLVAPSGFSSPGTAALSAGPGGTWRVWAPTWNTELGSLNGDGSTPTMFGCVFGDTSTCSVSQVALPAGRSGLFFSEQPILTITSASISSPRGRALPDLPFTVEGLVAGNTPTEAVAGALSTPATPGSPEGSYAILPGSLRSPLGYVLDFGPITSTDFPPLLTLTAAIDQQRPPLDMSMSQLMSSTSSDTYGRNLAVPSMCLAPGAARRDRSVGDGIDLLGLEWGRVRLQPQLSSCVEIATDQSCAAF
ncbi:MAG: filamentous hemagglutinin N-terminal domain-containing protein [Burkholderiales bacterium]|nr:filamentous hemagglutinin N-terminal domain-containing protein [Burkholderiales bacterium]